MLCLENNFSVRILIGHFFLIILSIAAIILGGLNIHNCPIQPFIPVWLIVIGSSFFLISIIFLIKLIEHSRRKPNSSSTPHSGRCLFLNVFTGVFLFSWFVAGNFWIFGVFHFVERAGGGRYCNLVVFNTAVALLILIYFWMFIVCCSSSCIAIAKKKRNTKKFLNGKYTVRV